jgi:hypothetical protein
MARCDFQDRRLLIGFVVLGLLSIATIRSAVAKSPFIPAQGSTSPANGDLNPYGLALVPHGFPKGTLQPGQLLVSNFNNSQAGGNIQGEGTTIVTMDPQTAQQVGVFFQGTSPIGFTNALGIVKQGFVFAGSVFTTSAGSPGENGGLLVIDHDGNLVKTIMTGTNGPWGLAIHPEGDGRGGSALLFISNVLDGTVTRIRVSFNGGEVNTVGSPTTIASGYAFGPDAAGLVVGPAGLVYDARRDVLYVASEDDNEIFAVADASRATSSAGTGALVFADATHLHGPLGLMMAPNGHFVTANADPAAHVDPSQPSELVEFTSSGQFVRQFSIDPNTGSAFAILNTRSGDANSFAYVDDFASILNIVNLAR